MTRVIICGVVCCHLTVCSRCPARGGILCKLWKAITDYRQKPAWGLNGDNHSEKSGLGVPATQYFSFIPQCSKDFWSGGCILMCAHSSSPTTGGSLDRSRGGGTMMWLTMTPNYDVVLSRQRSFLKKKPLTEKCHRFFAEHHGDKPDLWQVG